MTAYQDGWRYPVAFPAAHPRTTLGAVVQNAGLTQLRIGETEKYAHVTYFFNGGREEPYAGETAVR
jgi:2,3-bisphosphoglycerate-independent phosphoglycerate mutase